MEAINEPRLRINRTAALALTTTAQDIIFNGVSQYNVNTFGKDPVTGNPMIYYDSVNNLIRFYEQYDQNYNITLYVSTTTTGIGTRATLQYRFVVPNALGVGVDGYFPFPENGGWTDLGEVTITLNQINFRSELIPMYLVNSIRTNGVKLQLKISNSLILAAVCTLNTAILLIQ